MNWSLTSHAGASSGNSRKSARMGGSPVALAVAICSMTYGRRRSRKSSCSRIKPYASSPNDHTSLGAPVCARADEGARLADAVEPEERAESAELEPAHDELPEVRARSGRRA